VKNINYAKPNRRASRILHVVYTRFYWEFPCLRGDWWIAKQGYDVSLASQEGYGFLYAAIVSLPATSEQMPRRTRGLTNSKAGDTRCSFRFSLPVPSLLPTFSRAVSSAFSLARACPVC